MAEEVTAHPPAAAPPATMSAVALKIPPFWPADLRLWFAQVEAQFTTRSITSQKTRFDYVIASLSPEFATEVRDLILNPPEATPYDTLKAQLIQRTAASAQRRLQLLFHAEQLGDRKPTQLLRRMQQLMGGSAPSDPPDNSLLRELFLQRLPSNVRMVLASTGEDLSIDNLAVMAVKIMEVAAPTVSSVSTPPPPPNPEVAQLREEVAELRRLISSLHVSQPPTAQRSRSRSRSRHSSPSPDSQAAGLCWYHRHFGEKAAKCTSPCTWAGNADGDEHPWPATKSPI